jgi:hypothetical protein
MVALLVLMFATPGVPIRTRLRNSAYGIGVAVIAHVLVVDFTTKWLSNPAPAQFDFFLSLLSSTGMMALPLLVWLVFCWDKAQVLVIGGHRGQSVRPV